LKVLHFSALDAQTGAGVAAARIHLGLRARGVESRFCVAYPTTAMAGAFSPTVSLGGRIARALWSRLDNRRLAGPSQKDDYVLSTGLVGADMGKIIEVEAPDIVQLHWIAGQSFRLASLRNVRVPVVWRLSDMWPFCGLEHLQPDAGRYVAPLDADAQPWSNLSEYVRRSKQATYRKIQRLTLVSPSRWLAAETKTSVLLGDRPIELIPTSCETDQFSPKDKASCRRALELETQGPIILIGASSMGTRWKGQDLFVEAMAQVGRNGGVPVHVVTFGRDPFGAELLDGLVKVTHVGPVRDRRLMAMLYSAADVFVAPSRMENLSNAVLESLSCGTPVVAFDIGGMPDMIDHKVNGFLASPFDTGELAEGIGWAIHQVDPVAVRRAAREKVLSGFSLTQEIDSYLSLYHRLLATERVGNDHGE
jgi:glycosyltransferase involved in cell wall biosynthesis